MPVYKFHLLEAYSEVKHGVSTRFAPRNPLWDEVQPEQPDDYKVGGANLGLSDEIIIKRRGEFLAAIGGDPETQLTSITSGYQQHTAIVTVVGAEMYGAERTWRNSLPVTDGLVTDLSGLPLMTGHADCPPILFYDPRKRVIGAAHSGWRGTVSKIAQEMVRTMQASFGSNPQDIIVGIGPSIGGCCYTVGEPVLSQVLEAFGAETGKKLLPQQADGTYTFDLWAAIYHTLLVAGVLPENIEVSEYCSMCNQDTFFSYRAATPEMKGRQGNYGAMIMLA